MSSFVGRNPESTSWKKEGTPCKTMARREKEAVGLVTEAKVSTCDIEGPLRPVAFFQRANKP